MQRKEKNSKASTHQWVMASAKEPVNEGLHAVSVNCLLHPIGYDRFTIIDPENNQTLGQIINEFWQDVPHLWRAAASQVKYGTCSIVP